MVSIQHRRPALRRSRPGSPRRCTLRGPAALLFGLGAWVLPSLASAQEEVHWLDQDRYLISYRERDTRNSSRALANALERATALCQLARRGAYAVNLEDLRERIRTATNRLAVDVVLLDEVSEQGPPGRVVRPCLGVQVDRKILAVVGKALRKADLQP